MINKNMKNISADVLQNNYKQIVIVFILFVSIVLIGFKVLGESEDDIRQEDEYHAHTVLISFENDPTMSLLGKSFTEITQSLGEPVEEGYSEIYGPHQYILYKYDKGFVRFSSPESMDNEIAISIILGPGQNVLGATIGMKFSEIIGILGTPDYGPGKGIDNLYYIDYFFGKKNNQLPGVYLSFTANSMDSATDHAFIKQENSNFQ